MEQAWYGSWLRLEYLKELWARDVTIGLQFVVGNLFAVFFAKDEHCNPEGKMKLFSIEVFVCLLMPQLFLAAAENTLDRPNIVWIVGENLKLDLGCYGAQHVKTPHLDSLAKEGMQYTKFFNVTGVHQAVVHFLPACIKRLLIHTTCGRTEKMTIVFLRE